MFLTSSLHDYSDKKAKENYSHFESLLTNIHSITSSVDRYLFWHVLALVTILVIYI